MMMVSFQPFTVSSSLFILIKQFGIEEAYMLCFYGRPNNSYDTGYKDAQSRKIRM